MHLYDFVSLLPYMLQGFPQCTAGEQPEPPSAALTKLTMPSHLSPLVKRGGNMQPKSYTDIIHIRKQELHKCVTLQDHFFFFFSTFIMHFTTLQRRNTSSYKAHHCSSQPGVGQGKMICSPEFQLSHPWQLLKLEILPPSPSENLHCCH